VGPIKQAKRYMLPQTMLLNGWKQEHWKLIQLQSQQNFYMNAY
jgi:hypothetical protein